MMKAVLAACTSYALADGTGNPFEGKTMYVNPSFQAELDTSIATASGDAKKNLQAMRDIGSAYWIDVKAKLHGTDSTSTVEGILADAQGKGHMVTFIHYDLPNRDCHAKASNGEICCKYKEDRTCDYEYTGECTAGLHEYKTEYVDVFADILSKYDGKVDIALVIEPDSLPNVASNLSDPHCANSADAYKEGIAYAINTFAEKAPHTAMYLDAAHGGWLGWSANMGKFVDVVKALPYQKLRGFATNVANYQPLGEACPWDGGSDRNNYCLNGAHQDAPCCADPCKLEGQWNMGNNEMNYVELLVKQFGAAGYTPHMITDTGRNGVADERSSCSNWCNVRGAGVGHLPTTETGNEHIDAFLWLKTPGESDGCTKTLPDGTQCPRFDAMCSSSDSLGSASGEPRAPQAGQWFDYQIKHLAENACFGKPTTVLVV